MMMKILRMLMKILRIMKLSKTQRGNVNKSSYFVFFKLINPNTQQITTAHGTSKLMNE